MDRADIFNELTVAMGGEDSRCFRNQLPAGRVKSRVVEAHATTADADGVAHLLEQVRSPSGLTVRALCEDIWALVDDDRLLILDTFDPRFWLVHSTASTDRIDRIVRGAFLVDARFDTAWMPTDMLDGFGGRRRLVAASFASDALVASATTGGTARRLRVRLEGEAPDDLLRLLRQDERFAAAAPLGSVGASFDEPALGDAMVVVDYRGRFISTGTSFDVAAGAIWSIVARYHAWIASIEDEYRIVSAHDDGEEGFRLTGTVARLMLPRPIPDLDRFLAGLFSCREPFRLWAVPRQTAEAFFEANAVDLHVGQPLRLEISAREIRVILHAAACGNTLARLVVNLQRHLDARLALPAGADVAAA